MKARSQFVGGLLAVSLFTLSVSPASTFAQRSERDGARATPGERRAKPSSRANVTTKPAPALRRDSANRNAGANRQAAPNRVIVKPSREFRTQPSRVADDRRSRPGQRPGQFVRPAPPRAVAPPPRPFRPPVAAYRRPPGVAILPHGHRIVTHRGERLYLSGRWWYRPGPRGYVTVIPPYGFVTPVLPAVFATVAIGGLIYYVADGVYYRRASQGYEVVTPPAAPEADLMPPLYVYPAQGQSDAQVASDRYECHRWAVEQTGFDPTSPGGGVDPSRLPDARGEYRRATEACLTGRGYTVS